MQAQKIIYAFLAIMFTTIGFTLPVLAGNSGGGSGGLYCPQHATLPMRLLEFWEAEGMQNRDRVMKPLPPFDKIIEINRTDEPVAVQIQNALERLKSINPEFGTLVEKTYNEKILSPGHSDSRLGGRIAPPTDTLQPFEPEGCDRVGIGSYSDLLEELFYDYEYLEMMPKTDQAGFWLHEAIYKTIRDSQRDISRYEPFEINSVETRVIVVNLFTKNFSMAPLSAKPAQSISNYMCSRPARLPSRRDEANFWEYVPKLNFYLHKFSDHLEVVPVFIMVAGLAREYEMTVDMGEHFIFSERILMVNSGFESGPFYIKSIHNQKGMKLFVSFEEEVEDLYNKAQGDVFEFNAIMQLASNWSNIEFSRDIIGRPGFDDFKITCQAY